MTRLKEKDRMRQPAWRLRSAGPIAESIEMLFADEIKPLSPMHFVGVDLTCPG
jgi:hypothetical protein